MADHDQALLNRKLVEYCERMNSGWDRIEANMDLMMSMVQELSKSFGSYISQSSRSDPRECEVIDGYGSSTLPFLEVGLPVTECLQLSPSEQKSDFSNINLHPDSIVGEVPACTEGSRRKVQQTETEVFHSPFTVNEQVNQPHGRYLFDELPNPFLVERNTVNADERAYKVFDKMSKPTSMVDEGWISLFLDKMGGSYGFRASNAINRMCIFPTHAIEVETYECKQTYLFIDNDDLFLFDPGGWRIWSGNDSYSFYHIELFDNICWKIKIVNTGCGPIDPKGRKDICLLFGSVYCENVITFIDIKEMFHFDPGGCSLPQIGRRLPLYSRVVEAMPIEFIVIPATVTNLGVKLRKQDVTWSWTHLSLIQGAANAWAQLNVQAGDAFCGPTSLGWIMGSYVLYSCFLSSATHALYHGSQLGCGFGKFAEAGITVLGSFPSLGKTRKRTYYMECLNWTKINNEDGPNNGIDVSTGKKINSAGEFKINVDDRPNFIHPNTTLGQGVSIGSFCTIEAFVMLGYDCHLYAWSHVLGNTQLRYTIIGHHLMDGIKCTFMIYLTGNDCFFDIDTSTQFVRRQLYEVSEIYVPKLDTFSELQQNRGEPLMNYGILPTLNKAFLGQSYPTVNFIRLFVYIHGLMDQLSNAFALLDTDDIETIELYSMSDVSFTIEGKSLAVSPEQYILKDGEGPATQYISMNHWDDIPFDCKLHKWVAKVLIIVFDPGGSTWSHNDYDPFEFTNGKHEPDEGLQREIEATFHIDVTEIINTVKKQLGQHHRIDDQPLAIEFDLLPLGAPEWHKQLQKTHDEQTNQIIRVMEAMLKGILLENFVWDPDPFGAFLIHHLEDKAVV